MKKKILIIIIGLSLIIGVTAGCADNNQAQEDSTMLAKQDAVDVVGTVQIEEELGIKILLPTIIESETSRIIDGQIGVIDFQYNGINYSYYVEASDAELDATGMAKDLPNPETVLASKATYKMAYETDGVGVSYWYDKNNKVACTLLISEKTTPDDLKAMTEDIISIQ